MVGDANVGARALAWERGEVGVDGVDGVVLFQLMQVLEGRWSVWTIFSTTSHDPIIAFITEVHHCGPMVLIVSIH